MEIFRKSITMYGFNYNNLIPKYIAQFNSEIPNKVVSGEIRYRQHVYDGLAEGGEAILAVLKGLNTGKAVVHVGEDA